MKTALVAGHTGLVGGKLLDLLLQDDRYDKIITVGRRKLSLENTKLDQRIVNLDDFEISDRVDDVFCCLGTTIKAAGSKEQFRKVDYHYPLNLAKVGIVAGAQAYSLVSAQGADSSSMFFYNKVKGELEFELTKLDYPKLEILRPSLLLGNRKDKRGGEAIAQIIMKPLSFMFIGPLKNIKAIKAETVARAMVAYANDGGGGNRIHFSGVLQRFAS